MPKLPIGAVLLAASLLSVTFVATAGSGDLKSGSPRNLAAPRIAGLALTGQTLTAYRGRWSGQPSRYRYAWQRCSKAGRSCRTAGHGARYRISGRDVGRRL